MLRWNARIAFVVLLALTAMGLSEAQAQTCNHPAAALISPANGTVGLAAEVTYAWNSVPDASRYELWASFDKSEFVMIASGPETTAVDYADPGTAVEWYVVTVFAECAKESGHFTFSTLACPITPAILSAPANGAAAFSPVIFSWTEPPSASSSKASPRRSRLS